MPSERPERASLEEVLEFANAVREAGGGNPIDALIPAVPEEQSQCLIARNLNFNCAVNGDRHGRWTMALNSVEVRDRIAEKLGLEIQDGAVDLEDTEGNYIANAPGVVLPDRIGQVAADFDDASGLLYTATEALTDYFWDNDIEPGTELTPEQYKDAIENGAYRFDAEDLKLLREMVPYIEAASVEARGLATLITEDGRIVL